MTDRLASLVTPGRRGLWIGLALFALLVALSWVGFIASDDTTYARGAYGWIEHFPYVGGHGTIRYPITVPMAAVSPPAGKRCDIAPRISSDTPCARAPKRLISRSEGEASLVNRIPVYMRRAYKWRRWI